MHRVTHIQKASKCTHRHRHTQHTQSHVQTVIAHFIGIQVNTSKSPFGQYSNCTCIAPNFTILLYCHGNNNINYSAHDITGVIVVNSTEGSLKLHSKQTKPLPLLKCAVACRVPLDIAKTRALTTTNPGSPTHVKMVGLSWHIACWLLIEDFSSQRWFSISREECQGKTWMENFQSLTQNTGRIHGL